MFPSIRLSHTMAKQLFSCRSVRKYGQALRRFSAKGDRLGFIGLGNMGLPMSKNLSSHNPVLVFDNNLRACDSASEAGMEVAASVAEIGSTCSVIFTMLPSCRAVDSVMAELIQEAGKSSNMIISDCSTVNPSTSCRWHEAWDQKGHAMVDAPVSGGVKGAADATLTFMVGAKSFEDLERIKPYLELMGKGVIPCGDPGSGAATKLCNNVALAAQMAGICEAMNLGEALGVDPVVLADVMNSSTARSWSCEVNNPHPTVAKAKRKDGGPGTPASRDYDGGFATRLMLKDLGLAMDAAGDADVALPITSASKELYKMADVRGYGRKDFGVLLRFLKGE